jgi:hypothetical protein
MTKNTNPGGDRGRAVRGRTGLALDGYSPSGHSHLAALTLIGIGKTVLTTVDVGHLPSFAADARATASTDPLGVVVARASDLARSCTAGPATVSTDPLGVGVARAADFARACTGGPFVRRHADVDMASRVGQNGHHRCHRQPSREQTKLTSNMLIAAREPANRAGPTIGHQAFISHAWLTNYVP